MIGFYVIFKRIKFNFNSAHFWERNYCKKNCGGYNGEIVTKDSKLKKRELFISMASLFH